MSQKEVSLNQQSLLRSWETLQPLKCLSRISKRLRSFCQTLQDFPPKNRNECRLQFWPFLMSEYALFLVSPFSCSFFVMSSRQCKITLFFILGLHISACHDHLIWQGPFRTKCSPVESMLSRSHFREATKNSYSMSDTWEFDGLKATVNATLHPSVSYQRTGRILPIVKLFDLCLQSLFCMTCYSRCHTLAPCSCQFRCRSLPVGTSRHQNGTKEGGIQWVQTLESIRALSPL